MVTIPAAARVEYGMATIPRETPFGIMDQPVPTVRYDGRLFHLLEQAADAGGCYPALDVGSGDVVWLSFEA